MIKSDAGPDDPLLIMMDDDDIEWVLSSTHCNETETMDHRPHSGNETVASSADNLEEECDANGRVSDALTYGPRFCEIFREYSATQLKPIDLNRHLMALCCQHLVPFIVWARQSPSKSASIHKTLLENEYLRPEVRNGIVVVLVYTFAAAKAKELRGHRMATGNTAGLRGYDMFQALQDADNGLGMSNKLSLRIYNDPFSYLSYLKTCISALIDAGAIPDNERVGQAKRVKMTVENQEELDAYGEIQLALTSLLDEGDVFNAKKMVMQITSYWQQRAKVCTLRD
jgi:hypothetical protein